MNPNFSKRISALLVMGVVLATAGCGGDSSNSVTTLPGTFTGTVKKGTTPVAGVVVTPSPASGPAAVTDLDGTYRLAVTPGGYTLSFSGDNLEPATASATVGAGETVTVDQTMAASALKVTVTLPEALRFGGPSGFDTDVSGITASATLNDQPASAADVTWTITDYWGLSAPPAPATLTATTGTTTGFSIPDFETVRAGANAWMNARYATLGTDDEFEYIQAPNRQQLLSFGTEQVRAMSFKVTAKVRAGSRTATGSAVVSPVTISSGANTQPLGMMVVANAPPSDAYAWTLQYLPATATAGTLFGDPPAGVTLQAADTKNPYVVPTVSGVYKLTNGESSLMFRVSTYHGAGAADTEVGPDGVACVDCHDGEHSLASKFDEWNSSAHANFFWKDPFATPTSLFKLGVTGGEGAHYSESCISCHVVGYSKVPTADNRGWDDEARTRTVPGSDPVQADPYVFPSPPTPAAWDDVTKYSTETGNSALLHRANIQCESCHGPLEPTDHASVAAIGYGTVAPASSMDAGVCMVCHDALSHHDRGSLWSASGHANTQLAMDEIGSASCARCHGAEGFVRYLAQQQAGTPGNLADMAGLSPETVHSQTCQTCHDPHSTELRLEGDTKVLAGGFEYKGAGEGALCMVCHNSRIGAARWADGTLTAYTGVHVSAEADIFAGRNAFFYGPTAAAALGTSALPNKTAHSFMANACADCHVKWVPEDVKSQFKIANTNHTFKVSLEVCAECHAPGIGERVQEQAHEKLHTLATELGLLYRAKMNAGGTDSMTLNLVNEHGEITEESTTAAIASGTVQGIALSEFHGRPALVVTLTDGTAYGAQVANFMRGATALFPVTTADQVTMAKAFYNYLLIHGAGGAVHNPSFVNGVLDATITAVEAVTTP